MKRKIGKTMLILIGVLLFAAGAALALFSIPGSRTEREFSAVAADSLAQADPSDAVFTENDIAGLPAPVQRYLRYCGYLGTPKMSCIRIDYRNVDFVFRGKKPIKIDYTQYDFVDRPGRIAYIDSSMFGIPFEGIDTYLDGTGRMEGVIARIFTLFCQTGNVMDQSGQATFLSEILLFPSAALQEYVEWETVDDLHAKATMTDCGRTVSGVFTFDANGELLSFETGDRSAVASDGTSRQVGWSVAFEQYAKTNGVKRPTVFKAIWHYDEGDLVYFNGTGLISADPYPA
ncbi:MAG: DUF6544 family protein [Eubacteriales bacterium]|nr:DUF6544 family protein [Eubacteriales bacterium]